MTYKIKEGDTTNEMTPLQFEIEHERKEIIQLMLSQEFYFQSDKIDINQRSIKAIIGNEIEVFEKTALYMSIEKRSIDANKAILESADIDVNEKSALHLAAEIGDLGILKLLLEKKDIDTNIEDSQGKKAIDYSKDEKVIQLLFQRKQLINFFLYYFISIYTQFID